MVAVNYLANVLPLNGRRTGEVSDAYPSLFTPAGVTFSIWGVIYLLLGLHVLYQLGLFQGGAHSEAEAVLLNRIGVPSRSPRWRISHGCSLGITTSSGCP